MVYSERLCSEICWSFEIIAAAVSERMRIRGGYSSRDTVPACACVVFCSVFKTLPAFLAATQDCLRLFRMKCDKQDALLFVSFKCVYNNTTTVRAPACICVTTCKSEKFNCSKGGVICMRLSINSSSFCNTDETVSGPVVSSCSGGKPKHFQHHTCRYKFGSLSSLP